jgi:chemosensory pili system protein ChpA (sensor histidine kinase/response regulator)
MAAAVRELRMPEPAETLVARLEGLGTVEAAGPSPEPGIAAVAGESPPDGSPSPARVTVVEPSHAAPVLLEEQAVAASGELPTAPAVTRAEAGAPAVESPAVVVDPIPHDRRQRRIDDDLDPELLPIFLEEAAELVPAVGQALRDWHAHPENAAIGHALQRSLHTLKGSARMCGAMSLGELTHSMESKIENALELSALPMTLLDELETSYDRMHVLHERLLHPQAAAMLEPELQPEPEPAAAEAATAAVEPPVAPTPDPAAAPTLAGGERPAQAVSAPAARPGDPAAAPGEAPAAPPEIGEAAARAMLRVRADMIDRLVNEAGEIAIARSRIDGEMRALKGALGDLTENVTRLRGQLREIEIQAESQMASRLTVTQEGETSFDPLEFDRFTRFQELTRMMAESVNDVQTVHQNIIRALDESDAALSAQARLNRELQQSLMRIRMVPFQSVAERLYRVVRQAAKELDKRAVLDIRGSQVELDRSVLERITAPFEHLLRNSVAHGIEKPADRIAAGKKELGEIRIELRQEGNEVMMAVSDDGAGINLERVRAKAEATGLVEPGVRLTDKEIAELVFHSGFSTASEVSQIAGRGVGMDVVKNEVQALGGRVEIATERGRGARFTIYLPLTLAVTQAVLVRAGGAIYAIPSALVEQVRQLKEAELAPLREKGTAAWQERQYGFRYLPRLLGDATFVPEKRRLTPVVYARSGANGVALQLDEVVGNQEIVVKNAGPLLSRIAGITGATVLGSGRIVLILNPVILADREPFITQVPAVPAAPAEPEATSPTVMIIDDSLTVRKIAGRLLSREGYNVVTAKDGVDAMEQLQDLVPDVMLVDIEMPRMDGFDLTRNVRNDRRLKQVPIIMITSRTAEKHRVMSKEIGVDVFLGKPYQEDELLGHIAGFVKKPVAA